MKKGFLILGMSMLCIQTRGFELPVHEYILDQAYELLALQCPDITQTLFHSYLGVTNWPWEPDVTGNINDYTHDWVNAAIGAGTWLEDYSNPMLRQENVLNFYNTHFWNSSLGDHSNGLGSETLNAYEKAKEYLNFGGRVLIYDKKFREGDMFSTASTSIGDIDHYGLILKKTTGTFFDVNGNNQMVMKLKGYYNQPSNQMYPDSYVGVTVYPNDNSLPTCYIPALEANRIRMQIFGRIAHLIQDCSVPAHAHRRSHSCSSYIPLGDYFEVWTASEQGEPLSDLTCDPQATTMNVEMWNAEAAYEQGGLINVINSNDPIRVLAYLCDQVALHFPTVSFQNDGYTPGNPNLYTGSNNGQSVYNGINYNILEEIPGMLDTPPLDITNEQDLIEQGDAIINTAIRATAGWLAYVAYRLGFIEPDQINEGVYLVNKHGDDNLGGQLSIDNQGPPVASGSQIFVPVNSYQTCRTLQQFFPEQNYRHIFWDGDREEFKLQRTFQCQPRQQLVAEFESVDTINFAESEGNIEFKDPWAVVNPQAEPEEWVQPNTFHPLADSQYPVFLNQNPDFEPSKPIYSLRAPLLVEDGGQWKIFHQWSGDSVIFPGGTDTTVNRETPVVFTAEGAEVVAEYILLSDLPANSTGMLLPDESMTIPGGAVLEFPENFTFMVRGNLQLGDGGSSSGKIILKGRDGLNWKGLYLTDLAETSISNVSIEDAENGLCLYGDYSPFGTNRITNVDFINCDVGLWFRSQLQSHFDGTAPMLPERTVENCRFEGNRVGLAFSDIADGKLLINNNEFIDCENAIFLTNFNSDGPNMERGIEISHNTIRSTENNLGIGIVGDDLAYIHHNAFDLSGGIAIYSSAQTADGFDPILPESDPLVNDPMGFPYYNRIIFSNTFVGSYCAIYNSLTPVENNSDLYNRTAITNNIFYNPVHTSNAPYPFNENEYFLTGAAITQVWPAGLPPLATINRFSYNTFWGQYDDRQYLVVDEFIQELGSLQHGSETIEDPLMITGELSLTSDSPCIDSGGLDPDIFGGSPPPYPTDPDETPLDRGARYYPQLTGTVTQDLVLSGEASLGNGDGDDVIIPAAYSLTVEPGTVAHVQPNTRLLVNGSLYIQGESGSPASFTTETGATWRGIEVASGYIEADHALIQNASGAGLGLSSGTTGWVRNSEFANNAAGLRLHLIDTDLQVDGNNFHDNIVGLNVRTSQPKIINNHVHHNSVIGIALLSGSNSYLGNNEIDHNGNGDYHAGGICMMASSPVLSTGFRNAFAPPYPTNNKIHDNVGNGIYSSYTGIPNLGIYDTDTQGLWTYGGFNHFYQNSGVAVYRNGSGVPVWADPPSPLSQSALYGQVNYWYANLMDVTEPGTDQVYGSLNWNPTAGMLIAGDDGNYDEFELLHNGLKSEQLADYQTAIDYYQQFLDTKPKFDLAIVAMSGQDRCYSQLKAIDQWQVKLEDISQNFDDEQQKELAKNYLIWVYKKQQMDQEAIAMAEQLIDASAGTEYADYYALEIALLADETDGAILAKSLPSQKGMVARIQTAQNHLLAADNFSDAARFYKLISGSPASQSMNHALPQSYALHPAYPNPFNPVTTIRYDLPEASQVQLVIYDIQGREVTRLINATREAGTYTTQWQGRDNSGRMVASGLYFYTLEALAVDSGERFRASRKFLLLK